MAYQDRKRDKKQRRGRQPVPPDMVGDFCSDIVDMAAEKQKARDLRQSSWWRKKTAPGICFYCGRKVPPSELCMDHRIPLARGGRSEKINIVPACKECNNRKKYLLPTEWEEYMNNIKKKSQEEHNDG